MIFSSKRRAQEVLHYAHTFKENFRMPAQDFYSAVLKAIELRQIPNLQVQYHEFFEGGIQTFKRQYLRLVRDRLVFDICAAPFGTGFFFSCRLGVLPTRVSFVGILLILGGLTAAWGYVTKVLGIYLGSGSFLIVLLVLCWLLKNVDKFGLNELDMLLARIPLFGPIYERFFQTETYYREDTRKMYLETVPPIVQELVRKFTAAEGTVRPARSDEADPELRWAKRAAASKFGPGGSDGPS